MMSEKQTNQAKGRTLRGTVVSNKMNKTIVVRIVRKVKHPLYEKIITRSTKLHVHDEKNECQEGDVVLIQETRPYSKTKSWNLVQLLEKAGA
jgi:small subunit ribosomal protein S17